MSQTKGWFRAFESDVVNDGAANEEFMPSYLPGRGHITDAILWKIRNVAQLSGRSSTLVGPSFHIGNREVRVSFTTSGSTIWLSFAAVKTKVVAEAKAQVTPSNPETGSSSVDHKANEKEIAINEEESDDEINNPFQPSRPEDHGFGSDELLIEYTYVGETSPSTRTIVPVPREFGTVKGPALENVYLAHDHMLKHSEQLSIRISVIHLPRTLPDFEEVGVRQLIDDMQKQLIHMNRSKENGVPPDVVRLVATEEDRASKENLGANKANKARPRKEFLVSRFMLSARSPVFRRMFEAKAFEETTEIPIGADAATLTAFVEYIHCGLLSRTLVWTAAEALAIFEMAEFYEMNELGRAAVGRIIQAMRPDMTLAAMSAALRHAHFLDDEEEDVVDIDSKVDNKNDDPKPKKESLRISKGDVQRRDLMLSASRLLVRMALKNASSLPSATGVESGSSLDQKTLISASDAKTKPRTDDKTADEKTKKTPASAEEGAPQKDSKTASSSSPSPKINLKVDSGMTHGEIAARLVEPWNGRDSWNAGMLARATIRYAARHLPSVLEAVLSS